jgi:hypothetical protein
MVWPANGLTRTRMVGARSVPGTPCCARHNREELSVNMILEGLKLGRGMLEECNCVCVTVEQV